MKLTGGGEGGESSDEGSDSEPSEDNLEEEEINKIIPKGPKKKKPDPIAK